MAIREFKSFAEFATFLGTLALQERQAETRGLEQAARLLQSRAKAKFGEYQPEAGPFIAWAELAESTKAERVRLGFPENEPLLRRGDLRESIECHVELSEAQVGSNDDVMVWQELGTAHIPPRSVLGLTAVESAEKVAKIVGQQVYLAIAGAVVKELI
jgi:hypothetical protein